MKRVTKFGISQGRVKKMQAGGLPKDDRTLRPMMGRAMAVRPGMTDRMGRAMASNMEKGVKKMAGGGLPADRYSNYGSGSMNMNRAAVNRGLQGLKGSGMAALTFAPYAGAKAVKGAMLAKGIYDSLSQQSRAAEEMKNEQQGPAARARGGKIKAKKYAGGGSVYRKAADGVAHKGKTKGKMVKMRYGGKC